MSCKVSDQQIMEIREGDPKRYDGYRGGTKIGDRFNVIYTLNPTFPSFTIAFDGGADISKKNNIDLSQSEIKFTSFASGSFIVIKTPQAGGSTSQTVLGKDFLITYGGQLIFQRYEDNNWIGMDSAMTRSPDTAITTVTQSFNCRHLTSDRFADIYKTILKKYSN